MFRIVANHTHDAFSMNDLTLIANLLYRRSYLHNFQPLLVAIRDSSTFQIVWRKFYQNLVTGQYAYEILSHFARDVSENLVFITINCYLEHSVRQGLQHRRSHLYRFFLRHMSIGQPAD